MSQENVEIVRRAYEVMASGDIDAMFEYLDPAIELHVSDAYFDAPHTYHGHVGYRDLIAAQVEVFDEFRAEPERLFDAGEAVLALVRAGGRARGSGVEVSARFGHLLTIRNGKAVRFEEFKDPQEAMKAAGLED